MSNPRTPTLFDQLDDRDGGTGDHSDQSGDESPSAPRGSFLSGLNPAQLEAVSHRGGHALVLAGAGSGKTRVLTHRIAWLIEERGVDPSRICALTFTNKAAAEMRRRVRRLIGRLGNDVWLSTFHSLGLRLLREWSQDGDPRFARPSPTAGSAAAGGELAWMPPAGFAVYNRDASLSLWRRCQNELRISPRDYDPGRLFGRCGNAVSRLEDPASWDADNQSWERRLTGRVWKQYRAAMRAAGAVDFDDLLVLPLRWLSHDGDLRERTAGRFEHLLVDEYQDTNRLQYRLVQLLLAEGSELMVVGDEDQAIYRWRGADLNNVLDFQKDFQGAVVVRLEQNYRSTQPILAAAGSLVANNRQRLGKSLWTETEGGETPTFVQCATDREEAEWVARKIGELEAEDEADGPRLSDIAVLYRTNAQSRQFEEVFIGRRIPHRVVGGQRFFARREVRDVLAYLQLLVRDDDLALHRAIATPSRGIGPRTLEVLGGDGPGAAASLRRLTATEAPERAFAEAGFSPAAAERLLGFGRLLESLRETAAVSSVAELIPVTIERTGYDALLEREENTEDRRANLGELIAAAAEIAAENTDAPGVAAATEPPVAPGAAAPAAEAAPQLSSAGMSVEPPPEAESPGLDELRAFLDRLALLADADTDRAGADGVRLMTVHAAKGLEFSIVFLAGMEEELFPHATSIADGDVEEERRLCYVGMTRARHRLLMSAARSRRINGRERWQEPSRFIAEIDPRHIVVRDYLSPRSVGSKDYSPSAFSGLGGRTGQRQRSRKAGYNSSAAPASRAPGRTPAPAPPTKFSGPTRPAINDDLAEGATVVHPMFGPGRILETTGTGDKLKLEIRFDKVGTKNVIAHYAKLEVPV